MPSAIAASIAALRMAEYRFPKPGWIMTHRQRAWVPNWLYRLYAATLPPWLEPFRWILNEKVTDDETQP